MFCSKCGAQNDEAAIFCQRCGIKLTSNVSIAQESSSFIMPDDEKKSVQPSVLIDGTTVTPASELKPTKRKSRKLPFIIGGVVAALIIIAVIALNWEGKADYVLTVGAHELFRSQGTSLTIATVLNEYIDEAEWEVRTVDEVNYVDISGTIKGTDKEMLVTIKVVDDSNDPNIVSISPESVTIDGTMFTNQNGVAEFLLEMFLAYEDGYSDLSELFSEAAATESLDETEVPETLAETKPVETEENVDSYTITDNEAVSVDEPYAENMENAFESVLNEYANANNTNAYDYCDYVLYDIDKNSIDELLVRYSDGFDGYTNIYSNVNGMANLIGEFWSRNQLLLDENGNIYSIGSNSYDSSILEIKHISDDGFALVTEESWTMDGTIFTHTSIDGKEVISENEYQTVNDRFFNMDTDFVDSLDWQPIPQITESATSPTNSSTYDADYLASFIGRPKQEWIDAFGVPDEDNQGWWMRYEGKFDVIYESQENPYEISFIGGITPSIIEVEGVTLDKTHYELIDIFGEPVSAYYDEGYGDTWTYGYNVAFNMGTYSFTVSSEEDEGKPYSVSINSVITDDFEETYEGEGGNANDSYYEPSVIDLSLVGGRWMSDNGDRIELFDDGTGITNLSLWDYTPGSTLWDMGSNRNIEWQAENGLLTLALRSATEVGFSLSEDEILNFEGSSVFYSRTEGSPGLNLFGTWMPTIGGGGGIVFNQDGTGYDSTSFVFDGGNFFWYVTDNNILVREYIYAYQWDYTATENLLTLFGSDSSTYYTRVGS